MTHEPTSGNAAYSYARRLVLTSIVVVVMLLAWHTLHIFLLIFMSIIFGVFLRQTGAWIANKTGIGINWGTAVVVLGLLLITLSAVFFAAPRIVDQAQEITDQLPDSWQHLQETVSRTRVGGWLMRHLPSVQQIAGSLGGFMHQATAWLYSVVGGLTSLLIILVMGLYLAFDADLYLRGVRNLVPPDKRRRGDQTIADLGSTLYWWLIGRLFSMLVIGILTVLGLLLLGMPLALTLGLFAALMAFVPNLGPLIGLIPAVLLALQNDWRQAVYVVLLYGAIQTLESYLITPMVQRQIIALPPALILSAQLIMGSIQGVIGLLVAAPLVAAVMVLTQRLYVQGMLDDE